MDAPSVKPDRTLVVVLAVLAALVVVASVVVFVGGEPEELDPASPEGVVQRYTEAVIDGDEVAARELLIPEDADDCFHLEPYLGEGVRVTLGSTREDDDSADVEVLIVTTYGQGPFGADESQEEAEFRLVRAGGEWRIETAPWTLAVCDPSVTP
ncbi:hypothetical protein [Agromyces seonyuensis]|uniref:Lipoprotein LpqB N-terminal domain-containing protein n=1 Tax=Agromyces seonyuensis TaxID=2662446 RepID=A0A6I4NXU8_9MICO|nr:hypothetical protein [Agromyces seonyuensis]MWB99136.1 hypothetical protein [Agromyces seonyuensis]